MDNTLIDDIFSFPTLSSEQVEKISEIKGVARTLAATIVEHCPNSADRTVSIRKLRESVHSAIDSIVLNGRT